MSKQTVSKMKIVVFKTMRELRSHKPATIWEMKSILCGMKPIQCFGCRNVYFPFPTEH